MNKIINISLIALASFVTNSAQATILTEFTSLSDFNAAAGAHTTIDFQGFSSGTTITTQYSGSGVNFTDGTDTILTDSAFVTDGIGLVGNGDIHIGFSSTMHSLGVEFPGALQFDLFLGASLIGSSSNFAGSGTGYFGGTLSTAFDSVVIRDWVDDTVFIDNLHFGTSSRVPEPSSLALLGLGLAGIRFSRKKKAA